MLPRKPSCRPSGRRSSGCDCRVHLASTFHWTVVSRESSTRRLLDLSRFMRQICPTKLDLTERSAAPSSRRRRGCASPRAPSRCTRSSVPRARRSAPWPSARASAARPCTATSRTTRRCSTACSSHWRAANPVPDSGAWAAIEDPDERTETALRELYAFYRRTERMYTTSSATSCSCRSSSACSRDFYGYLRAIAGHPGGRPRPPRARRAPDPRRDRPRARVPDLALADARAGARRRDAVALMCALVEGAGRATRRARGGRPARCRSS